MRLGAGSGTIRPVKLKVVDPWFKDGLQFSCTGCGNCCTGGPGYVWISDEEINRLADYLKLTRQDVLQKYCRKLDGKISLKEKIPNARGEYDCIFLKELPPDPAQAAQGATYSKRICEVYPVRPLQCRTWPFWNSTLSSPAAWSSITRRCPGVNTGQKWSLEQITARRDATEWPKDS